MSGGVRRGVPALHFGYRRRELFHLGQPEHPVPPGRPVLRLSALGALSDTDLGALVPRRVDGCGVWADPDGVWVRLAPDVLPERVWPDEVAGATLAAALDERVNLARLAERVADADGIPYAEAFSLVKAAFLALVTARAVVPA